MLPDEEAWRISLVKAYSRECVEGEFCELRYEGFAKFGFRSTWGPLAEWINHQPLSASACQEPFDHPGELLRMLAGRQVPALGEYPQLAIGDAFLRPTRSSERYRPVVGPVDQQGRHRESA
jgi:hypothetical protein